MTDIKAVLIPADEETPARVVEFDQADLDAMQHLVGGDVQMVDGFRPDMTFVSNEEGKVHNLPLNRRASLMLWTHHTEFAHQDVLVGDVLILGPADEKTGDTTGAPDELIELLFNTESYRYLVKTIGEDGWHGNQVTYDNWVDAYNGGLKLARRWTLVQKVKVVAA